MNPEQKNALKPIKKIAVTFLVLLLVGSSLIYFGSRNDAVSVAQSLKSGVLTADKINVAFENVGGKLITRHVQESQRVQKGDILMALDEVDTNISIERLKAVIRSQEASIRLEESATRIASDETKLTELSSWRKIEEIQATLSAARASEELARTDFNRAAKLSHTGSVSQSMLDNARSTLTQTHSAVVQAERQLASAMIGTTPEQMKRLAEKASAQGMTLQAIANSRESIKNRENVLDQLRAQLAQSQAELKQLEVNHSRLTLTAPADGKILKLLYEPGEIVPTGAPAVLLETDHRYVDIYVNENMVSAYQPGTAVTAQVPALDTQVKGVVRFANAAPSFSDLRMTRERGQADLTSYQVRIYTEVKPQLITGMTLEVDDAQHR
ncbi:HlyD family efflux transporter periplasmic adaptor subunit [Yersinia mollaretii]|nr:HlyD family efflux transporter periplasmic adaptor subunit [Yersinia mollaretii]MDN0111425.1 HlyD family efflux transporter periplasmic adaptor subunit [Yersinia mollaretii]